MTSSRRTRPLGAPKPDAFHAQSTVVHVGGGFDLTDPLPPLRFVRNYLNSVRDTYRLEFPEVNTAVGISAPAFPLNASDSVWQKYGLGERFKIVDPTTKQPAVRNVFLDRGEFSVKALQARGTVFWQCLIDGDRSSGDPISQRGIFDQLQHKGTDAVGLLHAVDLRDVRMIQCPPCHQRQ